MHKRRVQLLLGIALCAYWPTLTELAVRADVLCKERWRDDFAACNVTMATVSVFAVLMLIRGSDASWSGGLINAAGIVLTRYASGELLEWRYRCSVCWNPESDWIDLVPMTLQLCIFWLMLIGGKGMRWMYEETRRRVLRES